MRYCPRVIALKAGEVVFDGPTRELTPALLSAIYGADCDELLIEGFPIPGREVPVTITAGARYGDIHAVDGPAADGRVVDAEPKRRRA
jgi:hypothetical protein